MDFKITAPSEEEVDAYEAEKGYGGVLPFDPRSNEEKKSQTFGTESLVGAAEKASVGERDQGYFVNLAQNLFGGFNDIVLALPDAGINAIASAMESTGIVEPGTVDRNFLSRVFNSTDYEDMNVIIPYVLSYGVGEFVGPTGTGAKIARGSGQGAALATPFMGLSSKTAQLGTGAVRTGTTGTVAGSDKVVPILQDAVTKGYASAPATTASLEAGLSALSGGGATTEKEIFGTETGIGALTAPLAGPALYSGTKYLLTNSPMARVVKWSVGKGKDAVADIKTQNKILEGQKSVLEDTTPGGQAAKGEFGKQLKAAIDEPEGAANLDRAIEIEENIGGLPGLKLSPAEQTMDPALIKAQRDVEGRGSPEFTRKNNERKKANLEAIENFKTSTFSGDPLIDSPTYVIDLASKKYTSMLGKLKNEEGTLVNRIDEASNASTGLIPKITNRSIVGKNIRSTIEVNYKNAKAVAEKDAKELGINNDATLSTLTALKESQSKIKNLIPQLKGTATIEEINKKSLSGSGVNGLLKKFVTFFPEKGQDGITFFDWKNFREMAGAELGKQSALGNKPQVKQLAMLLEELDNMGKAFGKVNENFETYRTNYYNNVIQPYEKSAILQVTQKAAGSSKEFPVYATSDENVAEAFFASDETLGQFIGTFKQNESMMNSMKSTIYDKAYDAAITKEGLNADRLNAFINKNREKLTTIGMMDEFSNTSKLLQNISTRRLDLNNRAKIIANNKMVKGLILANDNLNPDKMFDSALRDPKLMLDLKKTVLKMDDYEVTRAFNAAIFQRVFAKNPDIASNPTAFKQYLATNEKILDSALGKEHFENLYLIADAIERVNLLPRTLGEGVTNKTLSDKLANLIGSTPLNVSNRVVAVGEDRLGYRAAIGYFASRAISQQSNIRADALMQEAIFNPQIAKLLVQESPEGSASVIIPEVKRRLNQFLFNLGIPFGEEMSPPSAPPVKIEIAPLSSNEVTAPVVQTAEADIKPNITTANNLPAPNPMNTNNKTSVTELFPFDPTSAAIEKRKTSGIMGLA